MKVLIAEDNAVNRELLCEILGANYEVVEAVDGQEAVAKLQETHPDLVLLDINMPVLDGFAVLQRIRENGAWQHDLIEAVKKVVRKTKAAGAS